MPTKFFTIFASILCLSLFSSFATASGQSRAWTDITKDKNHFDKNCDYKVWVLEETNGVRLGIWKPLTQKMPFIRSIAKAHPGAKKMPSML